MHVVLEGSKSNGEEENVILWLDEACNGMLQLWLDLSVAKMLVVIMEQKTAAWNGEIVGSRDVKCGSEIRWCALPADVWVWFIVIF